MILLGKIADTFTMMDTERSLIMDRDCTADVKTGDTIEVKLPGGPIQVKMLDGVMSRGDVSILVENKGLPQDSIVGCEVYKV
jgi:hypothetical protein